MPPKLDKTHGFMQSIIKNQVLRDEYDKEQKIVVNTTKNLDERPVVRRKTFPEETEEPKRTARKTRLQLYVPPHIKSKDNGESSPKELSPKSSPEVGKRSSREPININKRELKRTRRSVPSNCEKSPKKILFKFEYAYNEESPESIRSFLVKEDDNAEDLAETFGNQLGLSKPLKKALQIKLHNEIQSFSK